MFYGDNDVTILPLEGESGSSETFYTSESENDTNDLPSGKRPKPLFETFVKNLRQTKVPKENI